MHARTRQCQCICLCCSQQGMTVTWLSNDKSFVFVNFFFFFLLWTLVGRSRIGRKSNLYLFLQIAFLYCWELTEGKDYRAGRSSVIHFMTTGTYCYGSGHGVRMAGTGSKPPKKIQVLPVMRADTHEISIKLQIQPNLEYLSFWTQAVSEHKDCPWFWSTCRWNIILELDNFFGPSRSLLDENAITI